MLETAWNYLYSAADRPDAAARTLAVMAAWATMSSDVHSGNQAANAVPSFSDPAFELTTDRWKELVGKLKTCRIPSGDAWIFDGADGAAERLPPGTLELVRQALMRTNGLKGEMDLLQLETYVLGYWEKYGFEVRPEIADLITEVIDPDHDQTAYCAYDGSAKTALRLARRCKVYVQVQNRDFAAALGLLAVAGRLNLVAVVGDPLGELTVDHHKAPPIEIEMPIKFDHVVSFPPFNLKISAHGQSTQKSMHANVEALQADYVMSRGRGWRIMVVSEGLLFRTSSAEQENKARLGRNPDFYSVVSLPRGSFGPRVGVAAAMLIFKPDLDGRHNVVFVDGRAVPSGFSSDRDPGVRLMRREWVNTVFDAILDPRSSEICWIASPNEIEENDYNLSVARYVVQPEVRALRAKQNAGLTVALEEIADLYKVPAIPVTHDEEPDNEFMEVGISELQDGIVLPPSTMIEVSENTFRKAKKYMLREGDILLSAKGTIGKVGIVPSTINDQWVPSQSLVVIRLRRTSDAIDPPVLATYLRSWLGQELLSGLAGGATVPMLPMGDLRKLPIPLISSAARDQIHRHLAQIERLVAERTALNGRITEIEKDLLSDFFKNEQH